MCILNKSMIILGLYTQMSDEKDPAHVHAKSFGNNYSKEQLIFLMYVNLQVLTASLAIFTMIGE